MYTPLEEVSLKDLCQRPIMFDANIFMIGIEEENSNPDCSFENMKENYLIPLFESFNEIIIHEMVYNELDPKRKTFVDSYKERNVKIVSEGELYGKDPQYTTIFNNIAEHERVRYGRGTSKDRGEVYSLAYAAFNKINYFSSKEIMVDDIAKDLDDLQDIQVITFDVIVVLAYVYYSLKDDNTHNRALKAMYKRYCEDVIRRHKLPSTLKGYLEQCIQYIG